ncbi:MAG: TlyA family rRNA (cytidine-2'-O)-methyltransferase [Phycisphaeraceae bacterium]|nr:hypothetical protein [Phycisphaerales bacterium]MCB9844085.1 TlyA family rRNA (cytidine-2'-O)-methyltransferase [Phycisphaeraceae bacterium]
MSDAAHDFVGRGALKLNHALDAFGIDVTGFVCADFGCNVGGFTEAMLRRGASKVYALDTGYGALAWKLRNDERVVVMERTNALHAPPPAQPHERMDLVVIDMGWTTQDVCIPAALKWLNPTGRIITLIKPHYEARRFGMESLLTKGILTEDDSQRVCDRVVEDLPRHGVVVEGVTKSPIAGGKGKGKKGNSEWLAVVIPSLREG